MNLRRFNFLFDLICYNSWLESRGMKHLDARDLPGIGFIAEIDSIPIAAIFLRKVEGRVGMVDGLCTNPSASKENRFEACDRLTERILNKAKGIGMKHVLAWSTDTNTLIRSAKHGFMQSQYSLLTRDLSIEVKPWDSLEAYSAVIQEWDFKRAQSQLQAQQIKPK